jgi:nitroreductase
MQEEIINALKKRYAVKTFDKNKKVSEEDLKTILESGRLAPSSIGLEPWKFVVVENMKLREKLRITSHDQTKVTDASHIIVIAYRTDVKNLVSELIERTVKTRNQNREELAPLQKRYESMMANMPENVQKSWIKSQVYIPLGIMIETASLLNIDNCPMEGFDGAEVDKILNLTEKNLSVATILAIGYRGDDTYAKLRKVRRDYDDVVEIIK